VDYSLKAPPLFHSDVLAALTSAIIPLCILSLGVLLAMRARDPDIAFGLLVCVSVLIHPIAWDHYLVLLAIPLVIAFRGLAQARTSRRELFIFLALLLTLDIPPTQLESFQRSFGDPAMPGKSVFVPFPASLFSLIYAAAIMVVLWFLWSLESREAGSTAYQSQLSDKSSPRLSKTQA